MANRHPVPGRPMILVLRAFALVALVGCARSAPTEHGYPVRPGISQTPAARWSDYGLPFDGVALCGQSEASLCVQVAGEPSVVATKYREALVAAGWTARPTASLSTWPVERFRRDELELSFAPLDSVLILTVEPAEHWIPVGLPPEFGEGRGESASTLALVGTDDIDADFARFDALLRASGWTPDGPPYSSRPVLRIGNQYARNGELLELRVIRRPEQSEVVLLRPSATTFTSERRKASLRDGSFDPRWVPL